MHFCLPFYANTTNLLVTENVFFFFSNSIQFDWHCIFFCFSVLVLDSILCNLILEMNLKNWDFSLLVLSILLRKVIVMIMTNWFCFFSSLNRSQNLKLNRMF